MTELTDVEECNIIVSNSVIFCKAIANHDITSLKKSFISLSTRESVQKRMKKEMSKRVIEAVVLIKKYKSQ